MQTVGFPYNFSLRAHLREGLLRHPPRQAFPFYADGDRAAWREGLTAYLRTLLHVDPPAAAPPEVRLLGQGETPDCVRARLAVQVAPDLAVPCAQLLPRDPDLLAPAVLCLSPHPAGQTALTGELSPPGATTPGLAAALCRTGLRVLVPDLPGCGERAGDLLGLPETLLAQGDSLAAWTVREGLTLLSYLRAQPETPPGRLAVVGVGEASLLALLVGALAPDVKAVAVWGDLRGFAERLQQSNCLSLPGGWAPAWFTPGLVGQVEMVDLALLLAPRPLLLAGSGGEERQPVLRFVEQGYELEGCKPRLELHPNVVDEARFAALAAEFLGVWLPAGLSDLPHP